MTQNEASPLTPSRTLRALLSGAILLGVAMRLWGVLAYPSLWLDEAFSAKLAEAPLLDLLLAVPRFDTHPPLYYIQLHLWSLFGSGDSWLLLNSVLLDLLVMLSLFVTLRRLYDPMVGVWAAAIWAVLPLAVFFAGNVRMYAMEFLLLVWLWYVLERRVRGAAGLRLATVLLGVAVVMTHGLGFFLAFFVWLQAFVRAWRAERAGGPARSGTLVLDCIPAALSAAWPLGIGLFRQTEGMAQFDAGAVGIHMTITLLGMEVPAPEIAGAGAFALILLPLLADRGARPVTLRLVILPWTVLMVLSLGIKPVFMYRTLGLFLPFLAIALALSFSAAWRREGTGRRILSGVTVALFAVAAVNTALSFEKRGYRQVAAEWQDEAGPDATLVVPGVANLWGFSRYLSGTPSYSALAVQPPVRDGLLRLKGRLEGTWFDRAGLFGQTNHLDLGGRTIWPYMPDQLASTTAPYWSLTPAASGCLRAGDEMRRDLSVQGWHLIECDGRDSRP